MIKIYLDDDRVTPDGYIRTYSVEETIRLILDNDGKVDTVSLDNDLGTGFREGREVMNWIEEQAYYGNIMPIKNLIIHSGNPVAVDAMSLARSNAYKYWDRIW